jgi:hypothetical protein
MSLLKHVFNLVIEFLLLQPVNTGCNQMCKTKVVSIMHNFDYVFNSLMSINIRHKMVAMVLQDY